MGALSSLDAILYPRTLCKAEVLQYNYSSFRRPLSSSALDLSSLPGLGEPWLNPTLLSQSYLYPKPRLSLYFGFGG